MPDLVSLHVERVQPSPGGTLEFMSMGLACCGAHRMGTGNCQVSCVRKPTLVAYLKGFLMPRDLAILSFPLEETEEACALFLP
jgi:hypothetical protein